MSTIPNLAYPPSMTEAPATKDLKSDALPPKPTYINIKLCDNGWLVGVHYHPEALPHNNYGCAPKEEYVFNSVKALAEGLSLVAMGERVPANLKA
jgi:hypothetical protein